MQTRAQRLESLKARLSLYSTEDLVSRKALDRDLAAEAHSVITAILLERGADETASQASADHRPHARLAPLRHLADTARTRVLAFLFTPQVPLPTYCLVAAALAFCVSLAMVLGLSLALQRVGVDATRWAPSLSPPSPLRIALVALVGPLLETALLAFGLRMLKHLFQRSVRLAIASAMVWGVLHGLQAPLWFVGVAFSFFVMSAAYLAWRATSRTHAFAAAAGIHVLINSTALLLQGLGEWVRNL